jgi:hypothetical protein
MGQSFFFSVPSNWSLHCPHIPWGWTIKEEAGHTEWQGRDLSRGESWRTWRTWSIMLDGHLRCSGEPLKNVNIRTLWTLRIAVVMGVRMILCYLYNVGFKWFLTPVLWRLVPWAAGFSFDDYRTQVWSQSSLLESIKETSWHHAVLQLTPDKQQSKYLKTPVWRVQNY